jgi:hypothetical protein
LASTKYWRQQNIGIDKILRRQNIGVDKILAHVWKHILTVLARQSPQQLTSPRPRLCSPVLLPEDVVLSTCSHKVCCCPWLPHCACASLLHCTGLFVPTPHAEKVGGKSTGHFQLENKLKMYIFLFKQSLAIVPLTELYATLSYAQFANEKV